jgi:hypothetical protein
MYSVPLFLAWKYSLHPRKECILTFQRVNHYIYIYGAFSILPGVVTPSIVEQPMERLTGVRRMIRHAACRTHLGALITGFFLRPERKEV